MKEIWQLFDKDRNPTGKFVHRGDPIEAGNYHIVVHLCLFNSEGKLLCQKRCAQKKTFPLYWDITVGGSTINSETSQQGMQREFLEELGYNYDFTNETPVFTIRGLNYFDDYYFLFKDVDLNSLKFQPEEVETARYMSFDEIDQMIENDEFINYGQLDLIKQCYKILRKPRKKIRMLALDMDKTTCDDSGRITDEVLNAIKLASESGIQIVPATGRPSAGIPDIFGTVIPVKYNIVKNGVILMDAVNKKEYHHHVINKDTMISILKYMEERNVFIDVEYGDTHYWSTNNVDKYRDFKYYEGEDYSVITDHLSQYIGENNITCDKSFCVPFDRQAWDEMLALNQVYDDVRILDVGLGFLDVIPTTATKGKSLQIIAESEGLTPQEVAAIGDSENDLSMIEYAGYSFAVENANQHLKNIASEVVPSNNDDGVAIAIKHILEYNNSIVE